MLNNYVFKLNGGDKMSKEVLETIASDMKDDAIFLDGKPFNGRVVAQAFGKQGAAIAALANIVRSILVKMEDT